MAALELQLQERDQGGAQRRLQQCTATGGGSQLWAWGFGLSSALNHNKLGPYSVRPMHY